MSELEKLNEKIKNLRECLHFLIEEKQNLLDPEIISISKKLDVLLCEYEKEFRNNKNKV
jgi:stage 0 sporulation regulatory protein